MKEKDVSIVICVYNEEKTIIDVLKTCVENNPESEVLVVDDGSTDNTAPLLQEAKEKMGFRYIRLPENKGKSYAMTEGVEQASNEIILFWDADVTGIKPGHFKKILEPMYTNEADMVLGSPSEIWIDYRVNPFRGLTGERAMKKKDFLALKDDIREINFGIETYINLYFQAHGKRIKYTILDGLTHPTKYKKTTAVKATVEFMSEGKEIARTLLQNYDLITKRIELSLDAQNELLKKKIFVLQQDLNDRLKTMFKKE